MSVVQAFAALQQAYSIIQAHHHQQQPRHLKQPEVKPASQDSPTPASSQSNRLVLDAFEVPACCEHLLPEHLQMHARGVPCNTPFLALPIPHKHGLQGEGHTSSQDSHPGDCAVGSNSASAALQHAKQLVGTCLDSSSSAQRAQHDDAQATQPELTGPTGQRLDNCSAQHEPAVHRPKQPAGESCAVACSACMPGVDSACLGAVVESMSGTACTACKTCAESLASSNVPANIAGTACCQHSTADKAGILSKDLLLDTQRQQQPQQQQQASYPQQLHVSSSQCKSDGDSSRRLEVAILVPCRKAMRNCFPLNGTFFQMNEVFLDLDTLLHPMQVCLVKTLCHM